MCNGSKQPKAAPSDPPPQLLMQSEMIAPQGSASSRRRASATRMDLNNATQSRSGYKTSGLMIPAGG